MTRPALAGLLALASVALAAAAGHLVIAGAARLSRQPAFGRLGARTRASLLAHARLAPLSLAVLSVPLVQLAFWRFEPAGHLEATGLWLPALAAAGAGCLGLSMAAAWRAVVATRAVVSAWGATAVPCVVPGWGGRGWRVETAFPVVAVVGVRRPDLYVSADVLDACSPAELAAIVGHERAHVDAGDNLTRVLFAVAPAAGAAAARVEDAWAATAEETADLEARATGDGVTLARALTRVARIALGASSPPPVAMSAFIGGDSLETRVRRLLAPARPAGRTLTPVPGVLLGAVAAGLAVWGLPAIYDAAEFLVRLGR